MKLLIIILATVSTVSTVHAQALSDKLNYRAPLNRLGASRAAISGEMPVRLDDASHENSTKKAIALITGGAVVLSNGTVAIGASRFLDEYQTNPLALEKFIGKRISLYGEIGEIGKEKDGNPFVDVGGIRFLFDPKMIPTLAGITGKPRVFISGIFRGKVGREITLEGSAFVH